MELFKIVTDTTSDLPADYIAKNQIGVMTLPYTLEGETYGEENSLEGKVFYQKMRNGSMPTTSQVNPLEAKQKFEEYSKESTQILYLSFSSGLSGTYNSVRLAAEEIMEENKDVNIMVMDSRCASLGEGLFVHKAVELRKQNKSMEEVVEYLTQHRNHFVHVFTVDDLFHLYHGGRVSKTTAFVGTLANIKPILHVDEEGHLVPIGKVRGRKKSLHQLVDLMEQKMGSFQKENDIVFISHGDCLEDALLLKEEITNRLGITNFLINEISPTIGAHSGPGTVALFFMGEGR